MLLRVAAVLAVLATLSALSGCPPATVDVPPPPAPTGPAPAPNACDPTNTPPVAPVIEAPSDGAVDVARDGLVVRASAFVDPEGDALAGTELEILDVKDDAPDDVVWTVFVTPDDGASVAFADGELRGDEEIALGTLEPFERYAVRARHYAAAGCASAGAWSPPAFFRTDDGSDALFDPTIVHTVEIDIPQASIDALNAQAFPPGCVQFSRDAHRGTLRFQGETFDSVGVRTKGGCGSSRDLNGKASFKIDLAWNDPDVPGCAPTRRIGGQRTVTLNNGVQDPSAMQERLGYPLYAAMGVPAPRTTSARVIVNGALWGVYTWVETIDRRFLSRHYADPDGMMYEGAYFCDLLPQNIPTTVDEFSCFDREFKPDACDDEAPVEPEDFEALRAMTTSLQAQLAAPSFYPEIESLFDFDEVMSMWAVDAVLAHWDAYSFHIINNYRVYHAPDTGLWTVMPWGIDQTFGFPDEGGIGAVDAFSSSTVIVNACIADPECVVAFAAKLREATALFEALELANEAAAIRDQLAPHVAEDPRREYSVETWEARLAAMAAWIGARPAVVRASLDARGL